MLATTDPAKRSALYRPKRIVPPMSALPDTTSFWSTMVAITGVPYSENSAEIASLIPARLRAASITMHCKPKHKPKVGILFSRANLSAPTFPSIPRIPNPPGTQIASTFSKCFLANSGVSHSSLAIHTISTLASLAKPPARKASETDKYASGKSMYFLLDQP